MRIMIVGGTGLLGYHALQAGLERGHSIGALALPDIDLTGWFPGGVPVRCGNVFDMPGAELRGLFEGYDAMVYAVGPDDRVTPPAPAYDFFRERLVEACAKTVAAAREAGVGRCVILSSYFAYFDRIWPHKELARRHPYIRCRVEQAARAIAGGEDRMAVMVLELPYIFGSMPRRVPLWKEVLLDRFAKGRIILFPKGGTSMISARHVGEAVIGAAERGEHGTRYPVGDENHTYADMLAMMTSALGERKIIVTIPGSVAAAAGIAMERALRRKGLESGLNPAALLRGILSEKLYFDPSWSAQALGYGRGGLEEAIAETVRACYPERFGANG